MKYFILGLIMFLSVQLNAQDTQSTNLNDEKKLYSKVLGEERRIAVYLPASYFDKGIKPATYPVVYVLDAERNFSYFSSHVDYLSRQPYASIPEMIVVGIYNTNRTKNFTPTKSAVQDPYNPSKKIFEDSGGNNTFLDFVEKELQPYIVEQYRTQNYKILVGHSFSGLATVNCFLTRPYLFNAYVANDPSLWWDNSVLVKTAEKLNFNRKDYNHKVLYISQAQDLGNNDVWSDDHDNAFEKFNAAMKNASNVDYHYQYYPNDHHGHVSLPANYDALKYIFKLFPTDYKRAMTDPKALINEPYTKLSEILGFEFNPSESYLNQLIKFSKSRNYPQAAMYFESEKQRLYGK